MEFKTGKHVESLGVEGAEHVSSSLWRRVLKRPFDAVAAAVMVVALGPLWGVIALLIKLKDSGPVFFLQERTGLRGRRFRLMKFRTMRADRRPDVKEIVPLDHPDIDRLGRFLRRYKLDELPQLFNILKGDMSFIGPRPTLPDQTDRYDAFQARRLRVRPGLTGLAQVNGNTFLSWEERIRYDVAYVRACGFRLDVKIFFKTLLVMLLGERRFTRPFRSTRFVKYVKEERIDAPPP